MVACRVVGCHGGGRDLEHRRYGPYGSHEIGGQEPSPGGEFIGGCMIRIEHIHIEVNVDTLDPRRPKPPEIRFQRGFDPLALISAVGA